MQAHVLPSLRPVVLALLIASLVASCSLFDSQDEAPPTPSTPTNTATATQTVTPEAPTATPEAREPASAPDGRTGIAEVDTVIDALLTADAGEIALRFSRGAFTQLTMREFDAEGRAVNLPPEEWSARLAAGERSLFTVVEADPLEFPARQYNVVLRVLMPGVEGEAFWNFALRDRTIVEIVRRSEAVLTYPTGEPGFEYSGQANDFRLPSIERLPERYLGCRLRSTCRGGRTHTPYQFARATVAWTAFLPSWRPATHLLSPRPRPVTSSTGAASATRSAWWISSSMPHSLTNGRRRSSRRWRASMRS
jgi:hypothetical protein